MFRRVVVTGVTGGVGGHIAARLLRSGVSVLGISRSAPAVLVEEPGFTHLSIDLVEQSEDLPQLPSQWQNAPVVHCAAVTADGWDEWIESSIVTMTESALALTDGPFVQISSSSVYNLVGPSVNVTEDEADGQYRFLNSYSRGKWVSELRVVAANKPALIFRPHAIYGEGDSTLLPRVKAAMRGKFLVLPAGGKVWHAMTSMENLTNAVMAGLAALAAEKVTGVQALNVTDPETSQLRQAIIHATDGQVRIVSVPPSLALLVSRLVERRERNKSQISEYAVRQLSYERTYSLDKLQKMFGQYHNSK